MSYSFHELRHTVRGLLRNPSFAIAVVLTMALGAGPSVVVLSAIRAVALPPVPFEAAEGLVVLSRNPGGGRVAWGFPKYEMLRQQVTTADLAAVADFSMRLSAPGDTRTVIAEMATPNYFAVLRVQPLLGRTFREDENTVPLGHQVAILSEPLCRERFGAAEDAIGRTLALNGQAYTVVGVMPEAFRGALPVLYGVRPPDVWLPLMMIPAAMNDEEVAGMILDTPHGMFLTIVGRLKESGESRKAEAEARLVFSQIEAQWPTPIGGGKLNRETLDFGSMQAFAVDPHLMRNLRLLQAGAGLIFAICVFNLAHLFGVRGLDRRRDNATRLALGAPPVSLMARPAAEALLLGCVGATAALGLAWISRRSLVVLRAMMLPGRLPHDGLDHVRVDGSVVALALGLAIAACLLSAVAAARQSMPTAITPALRHGSLAARSGFRALRVWRPRGLAATAQVALAVALVAAAFLLLQGLSASLTRSAGMRAANVLAVDLQPPDTERTADGIVRQFADLASRAGALPGAEAASVVTCLPVSFTCAQSAQLAFDRNSEASRSVGLHPVLPDSFRALGVQQIAGRDFSLADDGTSARVVILNQTAGRWFDGDPIGRRVWLSGPGVPSDREFEIVGVVADVRYGSLSAAPYPVAYVSYLQVPTPAGVLVVRARHGESALASALREELAGPMIQKSAALHDLGRMADTEISRMRMSVSLMAGAGAIALLLAGLGLFAILSHSVFRAVPEIGIRLTLGATGGQAAGLVIRSVVVIAVVGGGVGMLLSVPLLRYVAGVLGDSASSHWASVIGAALLTLMGVLAAALIPAYRAARVQPAIVLRQE